jgi:hypothetical protein
VLRVKSRWRLYRDHRNKTGSIGRVRKGARNVPTQLCGLGARLFEGHFGSVPNFVELLAENAPPDLEGFFLMRRATLMETPMPNKMMELLLCAVNAADFQARFVATMLVEPVELALRRRNSLKLA